MKKASKIPGLARGAFAAITLSALSLVTVPGHAQAATAGTAGNAVIRNSGTVTYNDAAGNAQAARYFGVDVKVLTVAAAPSVTVSPFPYGSTDGAGATQTYTVTVRTNSNGPGTFSLGATDASKTNMTSFGAAPVVASTSLSLGSTMYDANQTYAATGLINSGSSITVQVPHDGTVGGSSTTLNGLTTANGGSVVWITDGGSNTYGPFKVTGVSLPALPAINTNSAVTAVPAASITLTASANIPSFTPASGWMIVEEKTTTVKVTQGAVSDALAAAYWNTDITSAMTTAEGATSSTATRTVQTNAHMVSVSVKKYSRNTATPCATGNQITFQSVKYCDSGVTGKPNETLEYLIVVSNAGTGAASTVKAVDVVPLYTSLVLANGTDFATIYDNTLTPTTASTTGSGLNTIGFGKLTGTSMAFDLGNPSSLGSGGTIPPTADPANPTNWYVKYQVSIN